MILVTLKLSSALAAPILYGIEPPMLHTSELEATPLRLHGRELVGAISLELASPDDGPPLLFPLQQATPTHAEVWLPAGLPVGRYAMRLVSDDAPLACSGVSLSVVAPDCPQLEASFALHASALSITEEQRLLEAAQCLHARGAEELLVLTHGAPGEGVHPAPDGHASGLIVTLAPTLAAERAAGAAHILDDPRWSITTVVLPRPLPDSDPHPQPPRAQLLARQRGAPGLLPCDVDGSEDSLSCLLQYGARTLVLIDGEDHRASALADAYRASPLQVEVALSTTLGPTRVLPITSTQAQARRYTIADCEAPPARPPRQAKAAPPRSWQWTALAGGGLVGTAQGPHGLDRWGWADLHLGLSQGPFIGVSAAATMNDGVPEPFGVVKLGWESPLPDRRPAYIWAGLRGPGYAAMVGLGAPLVELLDGRLRPVVELRGSMGLWEQAPWALGAGLSLTWRQEHPLPGERGR